MSSDLQARVRLESAAAESGMQARAIPSGTSPEAASEAIVVLDLDQLGEDVTGWMEAIRGTEGEPPPRVLGFFSHVQQGLGEAAAAAGVEVFPRGRFWRELPAILAGA